MGIEHCHRPLWGVQFHPESIATEHGRAIIENFYALARRHAATPASRANKSVKSFRRPRSSKRSRAHGTGDTRVKLSLRSVAGEPSTELLFERLFGAAEHAFWLDSADAPTSLAQCSYLGTSAGADRCVLEYDVEEGRVSRRNAEGCTVEYGSIFDVLDREISARAIEPPADLPSPGLARGLLGGFVGYLGYECKADCGSPNAHRSDVPDAVFMLANRVVAVDHVSHCAHLLALSCEEEAAADAERWLDQAQAVVRELLAASTPAPPQPARAASPGGPQAATTHRDRDVPAALGDRDGAAALGDRDVPAVLGDPDTETPRGELDANPVTFQCGRGREQYLADILRCQAALTAGESYEVCLTDQISTAASPEPFSLYRLLRRRNPAPFAAYLKLGDLAVLSSSPERFLSIDRDRRVQARPIKGTAARSADPAHDEALRAELLQDEKTFAEHLMIVDLLRNDLGRVCEVDSVRVPEFMVVESYPTVHQLISTITGMLESERSPVECVRACFPGGSMTGAPKLRTMGIIDDIERVARGVYSGALGYFGLDGSVDLAS